MINLRFVIVLLLISLTLNAAEYATGLVIPPGADICRISDIINHSRELLKARLNDAAEIDKEILSRMLEMLSHTGIIGIRADIETHRTGFFEPGLQYFSQPGISVPVMYETEDLNLSTGIISYFDRLNHHTFKGKYDGLKPVSVAIHNLKITQQGNDLANTAVCRIYIDYSVEFKDKDGNTVSAGFTGSYKEGLFISEVTR